MKKLYAFIITLLASTFAIGATFSEIMYVQQVQSTATGYATYKLTVCSNTGFGEGIAVEGQYYADGTTSTYSYIQSAGTYVSSGASYTGPGTTCTDGSVFTALINIPTGAYQLTFQSYAVSTYGTTNPGITGTYSGFNWPIQSAPIRQEVNYYANPQVLSINVSIPSTTSKIPQDTDGVVTFELGNNGSDPIPPGGAVFTISIPSWVTVKQSTLNYDGAASLFTTEWYIDPTTKDTYLRLTVAGNGIPAKVVGVKTIFKMTVGVTGTTVGGPTQMTINAAPENTIAQNLNTGDDNANGPVEVISPIITPISLLDFKAIVKDCSGQLSWSSGEEKGFSHFEVEHSINGTSFSSAGVVNAKGSNSRYSYVHQAQSRGANYYRLKMVDANGKAVYSAVAQLQNSCAHRSLALYPAITSTRATLRGTEAKDMISIIGANGQLISTLQGSALQTQLDLTGLSAGVYQVVVKNGAENVYQTKVIKQ